MSAQEDAVGQGGGSALAVGGDVVGVAPGGWAVAAGEGAAAVAEFVESAEFAGEQPDPIGLSWGSRPPLPSSRLRSATGVATAAAVAAATTATTAAGASRLQLQPGLSPHVCARERRLTWSFGGEVPPDQIRAILGLFTGQRGALVRTRLHRPQPELTHQVRDQPHRALVALPFPVTPFASQPVSAATRRTRRTMTAARVRRACAGVSSHSARREAGAGNAQLGAHPADRVGGLLRLDQRSTLGYCGAPAKKAAAFSGTRSPSAAGDSHPRAPARAHAPPRTLTGSRSPLSLRQALTQLPNVPSWIPRSRATSAIGFPVSITICTASALNCGLNFHTLSWSRFVTARSPTGRCMW